MDNNDPAATPPSPAPASAPAPAAMSGGDERTMALLAHLLPLAVGFWAPLVIWLVYREKSAFVADQSKEALNFQITVFIASMACLVASLVTCGIGVLLFVPLMIAVLVFCISAAVQVNKGKAYRYPVCIRLIK